jgi:hypothetical protein
VAGALRREGRGIADGRLELSDGRAALNSAGTDGGGIANSASGTVQLRSVTLTANTADADGVAFYSLGCSLISTLAGATLNGTVLLAGIAGAVRLDRFVILDIILC